jgi:hypothetical protein
VVRKGLAADIPVDDAWADGVICAQSFHWFSTLDALASMSRAMKPAASLGLVWNVEDYNNTTRHRSPHPWTLALRAYSSTSTLSRRPTRPPYASATRLGAEPSPPGPGPSGSSARSARSSSRGRRTSTPTTFGRALGRCLRSPRWTVTSSRLRRSCSTRLSLARGPKGTRRGG